MTQHGISCLAAVLASLCILFMPGGTSGCTGERYCDCFVRTTPWIVAVLYSLVLTIIYFNSNNLVWNDEIPHNMGAYLHVHNATLIL